jgi:hypothetical protein
MRLDPGETRLIEARLLRDTARSIVRTDLDTLRLGLAERPLGLRVRDRAISRATDLAQSTLDLAMASKAVVGLTVAVLAGWLFRKRLGSIAQSGWTTIAGAVANWHASRSDV